MIESKQNYSASKVHIMAKYTASFWKDEIHRYKEDYKKFSEAGKKIIKRYRDERKESENSEARFNMLWSNVRTLKPAVYSKPPKVEVSRRFKDKNDVARVASMILERIIDFEVTQFNDYHSALSNSVDDRLLVGRGVSWIRYEPKITKIDTLTEDSSVGEYNPIAGENKEPFEKIEAEHCPVDYVYWDDFAHLPARQWEEVTWVARRVYLSQEEGKERFGDLFIDVPLTHSPDKEGSEKSTTESLKKAVVWEIWCKSSKKVYWVAENFDELLDEKDDPLELDSFFPCPKPIFATITTDSLIPVADFKQYQDQADEIDEITGRIKHLTKSLKTMGIYAADEPSLSRLLKEGQDSVMIPVTNWQSFIEKGGLGGAVQFMPLSEVVNALQMLYQARESCKQVIYETTGISDILRGASMAQETATAQQIKSQFASIRLNDMKDDVARFARDLLRMKAEVICSKYQPEIILEASGIIYTNDAQFAPEAIALLKNEPLRNFQIDIQTDTLVELDENAEKQSRVEFLTAASQFMEKTIPIAQMAPDMQPLLLSMLLFGVRGFKAGRELEGEFERMSEIIKQNTENKKNQPPQPDPQVLADQAKAQADTQAMQAKLQLEQQSAQAKIQLEQAKMQIEQEKALKNTEIEIFKANLQAETDLKIAQMQEENKLKIKHIESSNEIIEYDENGSQKPTESLKYILGQSQAGIFEIINSIKESNAQQTAVLSQLMQQISRPKQVIRGADGKIQGVQ